MSEIEGPAAAALRAVDPGVVASSGTQVEHRAAAVAADDAIDRDLMRDWCGGDNDAFDRLYDRHRVALHRFMLNSSGADAIANELFQDVWLKAINGRDGYTSEAPFRAWLFRIARNRVIDHYRRQPARPDEAFDETVLHEIDGVDRPLGPDELANTAQRGDALQVALQSLPIEQREAMVLKHVAGMSLAEIADAVDTSAETVKSRLRYARLKLRQLLRQPA